MVRFINGMGSHSGSISSYRDAKVQVIHVLSAGYPPSADGGEIREELPLREFLSRIFQEGREVENELYRVSKCLIGGYQYNNNEIERVCSTYDAMYSKLFRSGKLVLPQHKMSQNMLGLGNIGGGIDPYNGQKAQMAQRSALDYHQQHVLREAAYMVPPSRGILDNGPTQSEMLAKKKKEISKKRHDDLFYLTT